MRRSCNGPSSHWAVLKWLFGYPGYFLPWNVVYMALPVVIWVYFTPPLAEMKTFAAGWIIYLLVRNLV